MTPYNDRCLIIILSVCLTACGGTKLDEEQEALEKPPRLVDFSTYNEDYPNQSGAQPNPGEPAQEAGLLENFDVLITKQDGADTSLAIVQPYDKSWLMVAKALKSEAFDISDRDRDAGVFYVSYDPDFEQSTWDKTTEFFTGGSDLENDFKLKLTDVDTITEITAELVPDEDDDDDNPKLSDPDVEVEKFLLELYRILRVQ